MNGRTNTTSVTEVIEGVQVPLEAPTNLVLTPLNARVDITWTDPVDKFAAPDGQTATNPWDNVATWDHTIVVRKANSAPTSPSDGELIYTESTRNQHQYTAYSDTNNVVNNTVYYYAVYAITTMDAISDPIVDSCKPIEGTPVFDKEYGQLTGRYRFIPDAGSVGEYAVFAGGRYGNPNFENCRYVEAWDNSLVKHSPENLSYNSEGTAATASNGNNLIFAGGSGSSSAHNTIVYDSSLTRTQLSELSTAISRAAGANANQYLLIAGGSNGSRAINTVDVYDASLTKSNASNLPVQVEYLAGVSCNEYGIFGGGMNNSDRSQSHVTAYNSSLTQSTLTNFIQPRECLAAGGVTTGFLFAGGKQTNGSGNHEGITHFVDAYSNTLTKIPDVAQLPIAEFGSVIGTNAFSAIGFGSYIIVSYSDDWDFGGCVMYNNSFTQSPLVGSGKSIESGTPANTKDYSLWPQYGETAQFDVFKLL